MNTGKDCVPQLLLLNHHSLVENHSLRSGLISPNLGVFLMEFFLYERPRYLCQEQSMVIILKLVIKIFLSCLLNDHQTAISLGQWMQILNVTSRWKPLLQNWAARRYLIPHFTTTEALSSVSGKSPSTYKYIRASMCRMINLQSLRLEGCPVKLSGQDVFLQRWIYKSLRVL